MLLPEVNLFLVRYTLEVGGTIMVVKEGLMWGGNYSYILQKVCDSLEPKLEFNKNNIVEQNTYKLVNNDVTHTINIASPGEMFTVYRR